MNFEDFIRGQVAVVGLAMAAFRHSIMLSLKVLIGCGVWPPIPIMIPYWHQSPLCGFSWGQSDYMGSVLAAARKWDDSPLKTARMKLSKCYAA